MYKEAIEIEKCPENYNREDGWKINKTWLPIIHQEKRKQVTRENTITTEAATITTNDNCRCRKGRTKCKECQEQPAVTGNKKNNNSQSTMTSSISDLALPV